MNLTSFSDFSEDTIAALCTGHGGALSILRISGPHALDALRKVWFGRETPSLENARKLLFGHGPLPDGETCLAVYMPGPHSYTGEDVAEIHCHGGSASSARFLREICRHGVRLAEGGEFTRRAFLHGKIDLTQAEAVMDLISAKSESAARLADRQLNGRLGGTVRSLREPLLRIMSDIESRLDFSEEDLDWMSPSELRKTVGACRAGLATLIGSARTGSVLRNGVRLVIAGAPNAGKSSLLNHILGFERAIVTEIPGTTRDTLEENAVIRGILFRITDTAGLRETAADRVERIGIERSRSVVRDAEYVVWLLNAEEPARYAEELELLCGAMARSAVRFIPCWNKIDLLPSGTVLPAAPVPAERISLHTGEGVDSLLDRLAQEVWNADTAQEETECAVSDRHAVLLRTALDRLNDADREIAAECWDLAAECLRNTVSALGTVTGEDASPDILDEIFSRFCIGK